MSFSIIHDLGPLDDQQRRQYLRDASEHFGLNPDMNLLDLIWMDNGGMRRLVAYVRRGTTDVLRDIHEINILSVVMSSGPGFVCFTATGKNAEGRQEMAVGAAGTEGLKGDKLAAAVATAQTRAVRRLTLQFIGMGLLDESEVGDNTTTDINKLNVSLSSIATAPIQPVVAANTEAGKDVTPHVVDATEIDHITGKVTHIIDPVPPMMAPAPFSGGNIVSEQLPVEPVKRKRRKKTTSIDVQTDEFGTPYSSADIIPDKVSEAVEAAGIQTEVQSPIVPLVEAVSPNTDIPSSPEFMKELGAYSIKPDEITESDIRPEVMQHAQDSREQNRELLQKLVDYPTDGQEKEFRQRLGVFTNGILKVGGMTDGIIWRVRKYTLYLCPGALIDGGKMKLTTAEWTKLLDSLEHGYVEVGPKKLVEIINEVAEKA